MLPTSGTGRKNNVVPKKKVANSNKLLLKLSIPRAPPNAARKGGQRLSPVRNPKSNEKAIGLETNLPGIIFIIQCAAQLGLDSLKP